MKSNKITDLPKRIDLKTYKNMTVRRYDTADVIGTVVVLDDLIVHSNLPISLDTEHHIFESMCEGRPGVFFTDMVFFLDEAVLNAGYNIIYLDTKKGLFYDAYTEIEKRCGIMPCSKQFISKLLFGWPIVNYKDSTYCTLNIPHVIPLMQASFRDTIDQFDKLLKVIVHYNRSIHINLDGAYGYNPLFEDHVIMNVSGYNKGRITHNGYVSITMSSNDDPTIMRKYRKIHDEEKLDFMDRIKKIFTKGRLKK